jgi:glycine/D-amino acid oxidase-like deaminating enzyme/nitrite reductase/ring-hydroxylating ferredoxin subunit
LHVTHDFTDTDVRRLRDEASLAADLGFDAAFIANAPLVNRPAVRYEDQARFHPRKYLAGLARAIVEKGGQIFEHSEAAEFSDEPRSVTANGHTVSCGHFVIATHTPLTGTRNLASATLFQTKLALFTSYAIAGRVAKDKVPDALWWDTGEPYHYLRLESHRDDDLVIFGGEDHKTGQADDTTACYERLERALAELIPGVKTTHRWSGQVIETPDGLPYIGETAEREFAATGFSGNGMTFGTLAGMMASDRVLGRANPWTTLFDPGRKTLRGAWEYLKENKDYPYYLIRDRFAGAEAKSLRAIARGKGKVLEHKGQQVAAYRDQSGATILRSAICTHMGCLVDWNEAERTWDCPCHGSRFEPDGSVISGPAEEPLEKVE